jgi:hypothetical protein
MNLAPNGKPSNLTPEQYRLVRTPEFKAWFGDWENDSKNSSKVVDENGEPLVVWHGSKNEFNIFGENKISRGNESEFYYQRNTNYFHKNKKYAEVFGSWYGGFDKPYFLNIKSIELIKEIEIEEVGFEKERYDYYRKTKKLDGIYSDGGQYATLVSPNQIKLADGSNTTFDGSNDDIRYKEGGTTKAFNYTIGGL